MHFNENLGCMLFCSKKFTKNVFFDIMNHTKTVFRKRSGKDEFAGNE